MEMLVTFWIFFWVDRPDPFDFEQIQTIINSNNF